MNENFIIKHWVVRAAYYTKQRASKPRRSHRKAHSQFVTMIPTRQLHIDFVFNSVCEICIQIQTIKDVTFNSWPRMRWAVDTLLWNLESPPFWTWIYVHQVIQIQITQTEKWNGILKKCKPMSHMLSVLSSLNQMARLTRFYSNLDENSCGLPKRD